MEPISITTKDELNLLIKRHKINLIPRRHPLIILQLDNLSEEENRKWSKKINTYYYACGCGEGTLFFILGLVFYIFFLLFVRSTIHLNYVLFGVLLIVSVSVIGKVFGLILGKVRLKRAAKKMLK